MCARKKWRKEHYRKKGKKKTNNEVGKREAMSLVNGQGNNGGRNYKTNK